MMEAVAGDKLLLKDVKEVNDYLKSMDNSPEEVLSDEQLQILLGELPSFRLFTSDRYCSIQLLYLAIVLGGGGDTVSRGLCFEGS